MLALPCCAHALLLVRLQVCYGLGRTAPPSWRQRLTATRRLGSAWSYTSCCAEQLGELQCRPAAHTAIACCHTHARSPHPTCQLPVWNPHAARCAGLYAVGLLALYWLARASLLGLLRGASSSSSIAAMAVPSRAWQLDVLVWQGLLCSLAGVHVVHSLGAAWLTWLLGWQLWCGAQLLLHVRPLGSAAVLLLVAAVAAALPLGMAVLPFSVAGLRLQGALLERVPQLAGLPQLGGLLRGLPG